MPCDFGGPCKCACVFLLLHAKLRVHRASGIPCALSSEGARNSLQNSGAWRRENDFGCLKICINTLPGVPASAPGPITPNARVVRCWSGKLRYDSYRWLMVWTAPYGISCARMRLLQISDKGAVHERDYPNWNG